MFGREEAAGRARQTPVCDVAPKPPHARMFAKFTEAGHPDRERSAALAAVVESAADAIVVMAPEGVITHWNAAAESLFGYTAEEAVGRPITLLCPPGRDTEILDVLPDLMHGGPARRFEALRVAKDGRPIDVAVTVSPVRDESGEGLAVSAIFRDITDRRRAETALEESERHFRVLADSPPVLIWMADPEGKGTLFNRTWLEFTGRALEQELGDGWMECVHPDDVAEATATCAAAIARRESFRIEWRMRRADGEYRWMLDTGAPRLGLDGRLEGYVGSCIDITDRRQAEQELHESERRLRAVLEQLPSGVAIAEAPTGRFLVGNRRAEEIFRFPVFKPGAVEDYSAWNGFHADGRPYEPFEWPLSRALLHGETVHGELIQILHGDGSRGVIAVNAAPIVDERGCITAGVAVIEDVTERKRAEDALRDREERLRAILETAVDAIIAFDASGWIESFNPAAERMFGYVSEEVAGRDIGLLMPSPYREEYLERLARYRETGVRRDDGAAREILGLRRDGTAFPMEITFGEIDHSGRFTGIVRDVSERRALQEQLLSIAGREQRRIGQDLHDDVGQELTGLGLNAETLLEALEEYGLPEAKIAARIVAGLRRTTAKVRRLSHGLVPVEIDARGLMSALTELAAWVGTDDGVRCSFECPRPVAVADTGVATQLYRIAQEAVSNATRHARAAHVRISLTCSDGAVTLEVRDDGIGIPQEIPAEGTGLRIMQYRAGLIGGMFSVGPAEGGGTRVTCTVSEGRSDGR